MVGCLVAWLVGCLVGGCRAAWSSDWLAGRSAAQLTSFVYVRAAAASPQADHIGSVRASVGPTKSQLRRARD